MSANKPMLLAFLDTLNTLATGHLKLIIRLIRELRNLYAELISKFNVMGIRNPQRPVTHNPNKLKIKNQDLQLQVSSADYYVFDLWTGFSLSSAAATRATERHCKNQRSERK